MDHKVCHISLLYRPYFAGRAAYLERKVFKKFTEKGIDNIVITSNYDNLPQDEIIEDVKIHRIPMKKGAKKWNLKFSLQSIPYLFKIRKKFQIIHMHGLWDIYGLFTLFAKLFRKKIILHMTLIGSDDPIAIMKSYKFMNLRFKLLSKTDAFISISSPMSNNYNKTILPKAKLHQIPNGVDTKLFFPVSSKEEKTLIKKKLMLPDHDKIVVFVGAIIKRKGVDMLIDSWKEVNKKIETAQLILVGPDNFDGFDSDPEPFVRFSNEMKNIVDKNNLNVKFIGRSNEVPLFLKAADLFVLPSRREGFGNVVVEAMSTGLPVILTEMDGIAYDLIQPGQQGFVVRDRKELADRIIYLLENEDELFSMGKRSRERALEEFDLENICDKYLALYKNILQK